MTKYQEYTGLSAIATRDFGTTEKWMRPAVDETFNDY